MYNMLNPNKQCRISRRALTFLLTIGFGVYLLGPRGLRSVLSVITEQGSILSYLDDYEYLCEKVLTPVWSNGQEKKTTDPSLCPCVSPFLLGRRVPNVSELHRLTWPQVYQTAGDLDPGGHWRPGVCKPRLSLAVIIPYRDREKDLRAQVATLYPILKRQLTEFRVFVIEQTWPALYNKGAMLDIGYLEAAKRWNFDCVVFQDVDLIMEDDRNIIHCRPDKPLHLGAYLNEQNYRLKYSTIVGGALAFTRKMFEDLNGYTTVYFGWGGEDDNMKGRINKKQLVLARPNLVARYTHIKNLQRGDPSNPVGEHRNKILEELKVEIDPVADGLNSVQYQVTESVDDTLFTWINVVLINVDSLVTYHNRTTHIYTPEPELCEGEILQDVDVSLTTCKYLCDREEKCASFRILRNPDIRCILKADCQPTDTEGSHSVKGQPEKTVGQVYKKRQRITELNEYEIRNKLPYQYPHPSK